MKKIFNEYKIFIIVGLLVLIFVGLLLWPQSKQKEETKTSKTSGTKYVMMEGLPQRAQSINWDKTKIEIPEKIVVLKIKNKPVTNEQINNLKKIFEMEGLKATTENDDFQLYENSKATLYIFLKDKQIDYQLKTKLPYTGNKETTKAVNNFTETLTKILGERKVEDQKINFFKDEFRAVRSEINSADFMEISTSFVYNNIPLFSYRGEPSIKAVYNFDGQLGRLTIFNLFDEIVEGKEVSLINSEYINKILAKDIPIFNIEGTKEYQMSTADEALQMIETGEGKIVYIFKKFDNSYQPYYLNKGQSKLTTGEAKITFGIPLIKQ